jgi:branched-chain amino acid transport system substrate-binding protein
LTLKVHDHRGNPARGIDNITELAQDPTCLAVISGVHTPVVLRELLLLHTLKMPMLVPWAAGTGIIDSGYEPNYVFRLSIRDEYAGQFFVNSISQWGHKRVGLLLERTDWGRSNAASFQRAAENTNLVVVDTQWFNWGAKSLARQLSSMLEKGAETVVLVANAPEGALAVSAMAELPAAKRVPILSHWGITGGNFAERVGVSVLAKVDLWVLQTAALSGEVSNTAVRDRLIKDYQNQFDAAADANHIRAPVGVANAYDLVHLFAMAVNKAEVLDRNKIRQALETIDRYDGLIKTYLNPFSPEHHEALDISDYRLGRFNARGFISTQLEVGAQDGHYGGE